MNLTKILHTILDYIFIIPISLLPQHFLSRQIHKLTRIKSAWFKHFLINTFCNLYHIKLSEAKHQDIREYHSFNDFFTRSLLNKARIIDKTQLISPVDGTVSQHGNIKVDLLFQAKNFYFDLQGLVGGDKTIAQDFFNGQFATVYLSPKDYHRIHMPCDGELLQTVYIPGRLFPVNNSSVRTIGNLFSRNERLVCIFKTEYGKMALILVGALFVGSIETVWQGEVTPPHLPDQIFKDYKNKKHIKLKKGAEMGRFNMGSTVIMVLAEDFAKLDLEKNQTLKYGQKITNI